MVVFHFKRSVFYRSNSFSEHSVLGNIGDNAWNNFAGSVRILLICCWEKQGSELFLYW